MADARTFSTIIPTVPHSRARIVLLSLRHYLNLLQCLLIVGFSHSPEIRMNQNGFTTNPIIKYSDLVSLSESPINSRLADNEITCPFGSQIMRNLIHREIIGSRGLISVLTFNSYPTRTETIRIYDTRIILWITSCNNLPEIILDKRNIKHHASRFTQGQFGMEIIQFIIIRCIIGSIISHSRFLFLLFFCHGSCLRRYAFPQCIFSFNFLPCILLSLLIYCIDINTIIIILGIRT